MALSCAAIRRGSVFHLRFLFRLSRISRVRFCQFMVRNIHTVIFFPFLCPSYCSSVRPYLITAVTNRCNSSFFALFNGSFEVSMHPSYIQCRVLFFLFLTLIVCLWRLSDVRSCASSSTFLSSDSFLGVLLLFISRM